MKQQFPACILGLVTIGQSPRNDILPGLKPFLPQDQPLIQAGALDGLTRKEIARLAPRAGDYVLHTRLRGGSTATVGREQILPLIQSAIDQMVEEGADPILLLCTGEFPELRSPVMLIEPDRVLLNLVRGLAPKSMGVMVPLPVQADLLMRKWDKVDTKRTVAAATPYGDPDEILRSAAEFAESRPDVVVMDCMGYTGEHKRLVRAATGKPVILAASAVARVVGELLDTGKGWQ